MADFIKTLATGLTGAALGAASEMGKRDYLSPFLEDLRTNRQKTELRIGQRARLGALVARGDGIQDWAKESFPDLSPEDAYEQIASLDSSAFNAIMQDASLFMTGKDKLDTAWLSIAPELAADPVLSRMFHPFLTGDEELTPEVIASASGHLTQQKLSQEKQHDTFNILTSSLDTAVSGLMKTPLDSGIPETVAQRLAEHEAQGIDMLPEGPLRDLYMEHINRARGDYLRAQYTEIGNRMSTAITSGNFDAPLYDGGESITQLWETGDVTVIDRLMGAGLSKRLDDLTPVYNSIAELKAEGERLEIDVFKGASPLLQATAALVDPGAPSLHNRAMKGRDISLLGKLADVGTAELKEISGDLFRQREEGALIDAGEGFGVTVGKEDFKLNTDGSLSLTDAAQGRVTNTILKKHLGQGQSTLEGTHGWIDLAVEQGILSPANAITAKEEATNQNVRLVLDDPLPDISKLTPTIPSFSESLSDRTLFSVTAAPHHPPSLDNLDIRTLERMGKRRAIELVETLTGMSADTIPRHKAASSGGYSASMDAWYRNVVQGEGNPMENFREWRGVGTGVARFRDWGVTQVQKLREVTKALTRNRGARLETEFTPEELRDWGIKSYESPVDDLVVTEALSNVATELTQLKAVENNVSEGQRTEYDRRLGQLTAQHTSLTAVLARSKKSDVYDEAFRLVFDEILQSDAAPELFADAIGTSLKDLSGAPLVSGVEIYNKAASRKEDPLTAKYEATLSFVNLNAAAAAKEGEVGTEDAVLAKEFMRDKVNIIRTFRAEVVELVESHPRISLVEGAPGAGIVEELTGTRPPKTVKILGGKSVNFSDLSRDDFITWLTIKLLTNRPE